MTKLCRFLDPKGQPRIGRFFAPDQVQDLTAKGFESLDRIFESADMKSCLGELSRKSELVYRLEEITLITPVDRQEVWAAGVTYLRSKKARMEESDFSANAYDRVYVADRPELFFKSLPEKVAPLSGSVGIRRDSKWNVPEPELALVLNSRGELAGYTVGNDMSSRDIEGENVLYLPQAKIYQHSVALGPVVTVDVSEAEARTWTISVSIARGGESVFTGETSIGQIKRSFSELIGYLFRSQQFPVGVVLLTGTGVIPPDSFTLQSGDVVRIEIDGIGRLENQVVEV